MKFRTLLMAVVALLFVAADTLSAQEFMEASYGVSRKKIAYLTMEDGTTKEVYVKSFKRKKGLIEEIKVENQKGKKVKINPEDIKYMYLPQSGFSKYADAMDFISDATQWDNDEVNSDLIKDGYFYMEKTEVKVKKKTITAMLQLLNPSFCSNIRVYDDPFAGETAGLGVGGIQVTETYAKSHYVKVGDATAYKVQKKKYDEEFGKLFKGCKAVDKEFAKEKKWKLFAKAVAAMNKCD